LELLEELVEGLIEELVEGPLEELVEGPFEEPATTLLFELDSSVLEDTEADFPDTLDLLRDKGSLVFILNDGIEDAVLLELGGLDELIYYYIKILFNDKDKTKL
jgi:hypothetical protein